MPNYMTPGVYVEEVSTGARPIQAVGTSTAGFIGVAPDATAHVNESMAINNWSQFVREYAAKSTTSTPLSHSVFGFFMNGGQRCYVVNVGADGTLAGDKSGRKGIKLFEQVDEIAIVAAPGYADAASYEEVLSHCESLKDRVAILDAPQEVKDIDLLKKVGTVAASGDTPARGGRRPRDATTPAAPDTPASEPPSAGLKPRLSDGGFGCFYFPWIQVRDPLNPSRIVPVAPSGHLAGVFARTDSTRGVHKAPANEGIRGALGLTYQVTKAEQGDLNQLGINCLRFFPKEGIRIWGARTLADGASEWRYLNVRRLFNMIEESIVQSTRWVVFEPNTLTLWKSIRRDISAFLTRMWRDGALMGATPEEAFFVQCDEETNPPESIDAGLVVAVIGIAPVKPAEFIVFRIGQHAGGAQVEA
jgi:phage tail sheath protein FI